MFVLVYSGNCSKEIRNVESQSGKLTCCCNVQLEDKDTAQYSVALLYKRIYRRVSSLFASRCFLCSLRIVMYIAVIVLVGQSHHLLHVCVSGNFLK